MSITAANSSARPRLTCKVIRRGLAEHRTQETVVSVATLLSLSRGSIAIAIAIAANKLAIAIAISSWWIRAEERGSHQLLQVNCKG